MRSICNPTRSTSFAEDCSLHRDENDSRAWDRIWTMTSMRMSRMVVLPQDERPEETNILFEAHRLLSDDGRDAWNRSIENDGNP